MLVTFTTDAYADTILFGEVALGLLKMMGHSATVPGAILAADISVAMSRLKTALDSEKTLPPLMVAKGLEEPVVSLAHRALPLLNLLAAAEKSGSNVMWT